MAKDVKQVVIDLIEKYVFDLHEADKLEKAGDKNYEKRTEKFQDDVGDALYEEQFEDFTIEYTSHLEDKVIVRIEGKEVTVAYNEPLPVK